MAGVVALSLVPGGGHAVLGRWGTGLAWMAVILVGYLFVIIPGILLQFASLIHALTTAQNMTVCARCRYPVEPGHSRCPSCQKDLDTDDL